MSRGVASLNEARGDQWPHAIVNRHQVVALEVGDGGNAVLDRFKAAAPSRGNDV